MSDPSSEASPPLRRLLRWVDLRGRPAPLFGHSARSDILIAGAGLVLAMGSAMLPWYVFLNQDKFGIRALEFEGRSDIIPAPTLAYQPSRIGQPISTGEIPAMSLDFAPTGTLPGPGDDPAQAVPLSEQPFPGGDRPVAEYRLVHVANGRAMLEDENGLWVVQIGSRLPDQSRVASIEKRGGAWVLVTDREQVITVAD